MKRFVGRRRAAISQLHREPPLWRPSLAPLASIWLIGAALLMGVYVNPRHALLVQLPAPPPPDFLDVLTPTYNRVTIAADDTTRWNGTVVSDSELALILAGTYDDSPQPALLFHPDADASYERALEVMDIIRREGLVDRCFRFAETARYRRFEVAPDLAEPLPAQSAECSPYFY
ncbi:hypothetical protein P7228_06925 [Altererythrobacter arenosus]|uniref:Biopolymer transporter ExbD n=1 Tax=Altererythrobacter arenosus TaxID=3032592 RepID=A0ABY8FUW8_9SPHN|nr:biopolymer transporter ExbD [Altererythrobacter sp. CAU 1644]WFL78788.1 hypothetical protein P7228_06925 [Altererythrobacter sp. CAU 1644]